jgi:hypothetical protein
MVKLITDEHRNDSKSVKKRGFSPLEVVAQKLRADKILLAQCTTSSSLWSTQILFAMDSA